MAGEIQGKKLQLAGPWCLTKDFSLTVFGPTHTEGGGGGDGGGGLAQLDTVGVGAWPR